MKVRSKIRRLFSMFGTSMSRQIEGKRFYFDPSTAIGWSLLMKGHFESIELAICERLIATDSVVIDVGANIGVHTVSYARWASAGLVIAVEPAKCTFSTLIKNISEFPNVVALNVAIANRNGVDTFYNARDNAYSGLMDSKRSPITHRELVACYKGEHLFPALISEKRLDLVKIDVEGAETAVINGMQEILRRHMPVIACEIYQGTNSNPDPAQTIELCAQIGYEPYVLKESGLEQVTCHDDRYYNYFFLPRERVAEILPRVANATCLANC